MGNVESSSYQKCLLRFLPEEQKEIDEAFDSLSGEKNEKASRKTVNLQQLKAFVFKGFPESMTVRLYDGMRSIRVSAKASGLSEQISKEQFTVFLSELLRGTAEEKSYIVSRMILGDGSEIVKERQVQEFTEDLIMSVVYLLKHKKLMKGWNLENTQDYVAGGKVLAAQLLLELRSPDRQELTGSQPIHSTWERNAIENWIFKTPLISTFLSVIVTHSLSVLQSHIENQTEVENLVPKCKGTKRTAFISLLDFPSVMYINSHLPTELQHQWRLIFSSQVHGESFSRLCGQIVNQGPCLLVLKDSEGFIFGGFASQTWDVKPQFQGDNRCFLFSVFPRLEVYTYTGYNDHYMYLNHGQQTMPNGLGMGGQHNYFGLWIDSNYGKGHSKAKPKCTTYNSPQLSAQDDFLLDALEVWAVGDLPESVLLKGKTSILDVDPEAQALLEMTGKSRQSAGLRDQVEEDEN
ncbi:MTOR-associated protein MEAK7-like [Microcaecilia unicolor]|uniref:MTOR-associated protein MEAK7 n=1 Tax=Microcaecilia unicolor TaxID=1415580 RepID=A0A6P7Y733_9AMPH|nr:MTOR-associated protein MEAK7-like [Microcaecilia unicolor]XP_030058551.1 MTOR-associated protein MEAK7-like [Microcaecilia unicolor]